MKNNLIGKEFQSSEERLITEDLDFLNQLHDTIKCDIEESNSSHLHDQISKILTSAQDELSASFSHIKQLPLIKDIFARHAVSLEQCLTVFIEQNGTAKAKTIQKLNDGFTRIKQYITMLETNINLNAGASPPNLNLVNYIYDDEFVALINSLSSAIKEFFKSTRSCFSELKSSSDAIVDHTLSSKSAISDMFVQLNPSLGGSISGTKSSKGSVGATAGGISIKDKVIKDKLNQVSERLEQINEIKGIMTRSIKIMEKSFAKFYEDAKILFKKMKITRNQKMDEVHIGEFAVTGRADLLNINIPQNSNLLGNDVTKRSSGGQSREKNLTQSLRGINTRYNSHSPSLRNLPIGNVRPINSTVGEAMWGNRPTVGMNQSQSNLMIANDKEIKEINEKIMGLTRRNEDLLGELTSMKRKMDDIKFENSNLRQKLETVVDSRRNSKEPENRNMSQLSKTGVNFKTLDSKGEERVGGVKNIIHERPDTQTKVKANSVDTKGKNSMQSNEAKSVTKDLQMKLQKPIAQKSNLSNELNQSSNSNTYDSHSLSRPDIVIATLVLQFLNQMSDLQENISKKSPNVLELKKLFELKKQELIKASEDLARETSGKNFLSTPNKRSLKDTITGPSSCENSQRILQNKIPIKSNPKQNTLICNSKPVLVKNFQCVESANDNGENIPMPMAGYSPKGNTNQISFAGNEHESAESISVAKPGSLKEEISKLNAMIKSKESELEKKVTEISSLNDALLVEKEKYEKLEIKIKNEKSIAALIEEKLKEEKLKNKSLEEQKENLSKEKLKFDNMIASLQDDADRLKIQITSEKDKILKEKQGEIAKLKKEIDELKNDMEENKSQITRKQKELDNLKKINEELNILVTKCNDEMSKLKDENEEQSAEIIDKNNKIEIIQRNNSTEMNKEITKLSNQLSGVLKEKQAEIDNHVNEITVLYKQAKDCQKESDSLQNQNKEKQREIISLKGQVNRLEAEKESLSNEIGNRESELKEREMESTTLMNTNKELNSRLKSKENQLIALDKEVETLKSSFNKKEAELRDLKAEHAGIEKKYLEQSSDIDALQSTKEQLEMLLKQEKKNIEKINTEIIDLKAALSDKDKQIEMIQNSNSAEMNKEIFNLNNQIHALTGELREKQADIDKIADEKSKLSGYMKAQSEMNATLKVKNEEFLKEIIQMKQDLSRHSHENELLKTQLEKEIKDLAEKCESLTLDLRNTQKERDSFEKENKEISQLLGIKTEETKNLNTIIASTNSQLNENAVAIQKLQDNIRNISSMLQKANTENEDINQKHKGLLLQFNTKQEDIKLISLQNEQLNSKLLQCQKELESLNNANKESSSVLSQKQLTIVQLQKEKEQLNEIITKKQKELDNINNINEELNSLVNKGNNEIAKLLEENEELNEQLIEKDKQIEIIRKNNSVELNKELTKLSNQLHSQTEVIKEKRMEIDKLSHEKEEMNNQIQIQTKETTTLKDEKRNLQIEVNKLQKDLDVIQQEEEQLMVSANATIQENSLLTKSLEEMKSLVSEKNKELDALTHKLEEKDTELGHHKLVNEELLQENEKMKREITNIKTQIEYFTREKLKLNEMIISQSNEIDENVATISSLKKTIKELNDTYTTEKKERDKLKQDLDNMNVSSNKEYNVKLSQKDEQVRLLAEKLTQITKSMEESKVNMEKLLAESEGKVSLIESEKTSLIKENKDLKNRIAQIKTDYSELSKEKEAEIAKLSESSSVLTREKESIMRTIHGAILLKLTSILSSVVSDHRSKIAILPNKSFTEETESQTGLLFDSLLNEIISTAEMINKKLSEYYTKCMEYEEERKMLGQKLLEVNQSSDQKIREFQMRNKQLEEVHEEYCRKIKEAVKEKAPHLITEDLKSSSDEYLKALDLFRLYNAELTKINMLMEEKLNKALAKAKKYKEMYKSTALPMINAQSGVNPNNFTNSNITTGSTVYDPEKYKIISDKQLNNLKWVLLTFKDAKENEMNYQNTYWVNSVDIKCSLFNQYMSENDYKKEIEDLLAIQSDLLDKISKAQEELSKCKHEKEKLQRQAVNPNYTSTSANPSTNLSNQKIKSPNIDLNLNPTPSPTTIPLEKYEKLLSFLNEEQDKNKKVSTIIDQLRSENESLKGILEQNKSKIEKGGEGKSLSFINDNGSKFLDEELNVNEIFIEGEIGEKHNLSIIDENKETEKNKPPAIPKKEAQIKIKRDIHEFESRSVKEKEFPLGTQPDVFKEKDQQGESIGGTERRNSKESMKTAGKRNDTQGSIKNSYRDTVQKLEDDERLFAEQLKSIKLELRLTRDERDKFKRKYEESISIQDGKKTEVINLLKQTFEKLVTEINISGKVKEYAVMILKLLDYTEEDINRIINKKDKKSGFLGLFGKK